MNLNLFGGNLLNNNKNFREGNQIILKLEI